MLGTGFIGTFYTMTLQDRRRRDRVTNIYSNDSEEASAFAEKWDIPKSTADLAEAINDPESDVIVIGLPNHLHEEAVMLAVEAKKPVLCTKPLGRNAAEAKRMLEAVEKAGIFHGYLEDLAYDPKTLKSLDSVKRGTLGEILWVRSREAHYGPHAAWFWDNEKAGGGAIIDLGCHCIEVIRLFIGKDVRPVEVMCWADTLVHPTTAEDHSIGLIHFENGAMGQFEVSWGFRGGMDIRDEVSGTEGTIWLNHFLRTGFEMYTSGESGAYVAEKAESESGWLFPVGDELDELGFHKMYNDMFDAIDDERKPTEDFYDGYVVNVIMDACYKSVKTRQWEPVELEIWRGAETTPKISPPPSEYEGKLLVKRERLPDGKIRLIIQDKKTGVTEQKFIGD